MKEEIGVGLGKCESFVEHLGQGKCFMSTDPPEIYAFYPPSPRRGTTRDYHIGLGGFGGKIQLFAGDMIITRQWMVLSLFSTAPPALILSLYSRNWKQGRGGFSFSDFSQPSVSMISQFFVCSHGSGVLPACFRYPTRTSSLAKCFKDIRWAFCRMNAHVCMSDGNKNF